jgi:hypothetical protein
LNLWKQIRADLASPFQKGTAYRPSRKLRSQWYLQRPGTLMNGKPNWKVFDFPNVGPLAVVEFSISFDHDFQWWNLCGIYLPATGQSEAFGPLDFQVQVLHNIGQQKQKVVRPFNNKPIQSGGIVGNGTNPNYFPGAQTYPIRMGDSVTVIVYNLNGDPTHLPHIQVVMGGTILQS